MYSIETMS